MIGFWSGGFWFWQGGLCNDQLWFVKVRLLARWRFNCSYALVTLRCILGVLFLDALVSASRGTPRVSVLRERGQGTDTWNPWW